MANQPEHISDQTADQTASVYSRYRFVIGAMVLAGHLSVGLNIFAVSPVLPLAIDDYSINRAGHRQPASGLAAAGGGGIGTAQRHLDLPHRT